MFKKVYKTLSSKIWILKSVERRYQYGDGPLFAYSVDIRPYKSPFNTYWLHICNDLSAPGARIQISSLGGLGYSTELSNVSMGIQKQYHGYIYLSDVKIEDGPSRDLEIKIFLPDQDTVEKFNDMISFFGYS